MGRGRPTSLRAVVAAALLLVATGCGPAANDGGATTPAPATSSAAAGSDGAGAMGHSASAMKAGKPAPLRRGERRVTLTMDTPYVPSAPHDAGTDDYRCFLLDPQLTDPAYLTGTHVLPGNPDVVHHVILFRVPPEDVATAEDLDAAEEGEGWTCFGGSGVDDFADVNDAPWLGAWAPGGKESVHRQGYGVPLEPGTRIVMQVHYNLLSGPGEDVSSTQLRLAPATSRLTPLHTVLLPGPVELPCRPQRDASPLCERDAALADVKERFGMVGGTADALYFLCGDGPEPGPVQSCTRTLSEPMTVLGVAGHMHLLGRRIKVEVNPGTPRARTILDIPVWDFDDQGSRAVRPVRLEASDTVRVTCRHAQWLRDRLPAFESARKDRYVLWGEGTTDEMCLGILQVSRP